MIFALHSLSSTVDNQGSLPAHALYVCAFCIAKESIPDKNLFVKMCKALTSRVKYRIFVKSSGKREGVMTIVINGERYYTVKEAAEYLGISRPTFYDNIQPKIQQHRPRALRRVYYRESDLDKFKGIESSEMPKE